MGGGIAGALPLPATPQEERALWARLAAWLYNNDLGAVRDLAYDSGPEHGGGNTEQNAGENEESTRSLWQRMWGK